MANYRYLGEFWDPKAGLGLLPDPTIRKDLKGPIILSDPKYGIFFSSSRPFEVREP